MLSLVNKEKQRIEKMLHELLAAGRYKWQSPESEYRISEKEASEAIEKIIKKYARMKNAPRIKTPAVFEGTASFNENWFRRLIKELIIEEFQKLPLKATIRKDGIVVIKLFNKTRTVLEES